MEHYLDIYIHGDGAVFPSAITPIDSRILLLPLHVIISWAHNILWMWLHHILYKSNLPAISMLPKLSQHESLEHIDLRGNVLNQTIKPLKQATPSIRARAYNFPVSGFIQGFQVEYLSYFIQRKKAPFTSCLLTRISNDAPDSLSSFKRLWSSNLQSSSLLRSDIFSNPYQTFSLLKVVSPVRPDCQPPTSHMLRVILLVSGGLDVESEGSTDNTRALLVDFHLPWVIQPRHEYSHFFLFSLDLLNDAEKHSPNWGKTDKLMEKNYRIFAAAIDGLLRYGSYLLLRNSKIVTAPLDCELFCSACLLSLNYTI